MKERLNHARIVSMPDDVQYLDTVQLNQLEQSFRNWAKSSLRKDVTLSRKRILIIFLLIRYTGARLNEVLAINPFQDINYERQVVIFKKNDFEHSIESREVQISGSISSEIKAELNDPSFKASLSNLFGVDPGHVRRKFYERATDCGFPKELGSPDMIRKSRAIELMQSNMPLPVVQKMLGHKTPNLTASYVTFCDNDIQQVAKYFIEKESKLKTSARNTFFGKIRTILKGDIQSKIELITISGDIVTAIITNDSTVRLGLKTGSLITAEVKAPWVFLHKGNKEPICTTENRFNGTIVRINQGKITTEYIVRISDGTELCSVVSTESCHKLNMMENDHVWVLFNCFSVILHMD
ncbi:MAG: TOBE domain-containing protein [Desulfobacterales bacterium]|nr:TOBE domain-containing protein [Desulfobacterales bacterium]